MKHTMYRILLIALGALSNAHINGCDSFLLSGQVSPSHIQQMQNLESTVKPYPSRSTDSNGKVQQIIESRSTKVMPASKTHEILQKGGFTVLKPKANTFDKNYPSGAAIFPSYPDLSGKFETMIATFQKNRDFIIFFRKIHLNVLHQLYFYLMHIYVNFNLQHIGIVQLPNGKLQVSIPDFMQYEQDYSSNKKTLIINHLMNIIESQFNGAVRSYLPKMPHIYASFSGHMLAQNDYSIDLTQFLDKDIKNAFLTSKQRGEYLKGLVAYIEFFQSYTNYLEQPHPTKPTHFTAFVDIAEQISQFLYGKAIDSESTFSTSQEKYASAVARMNPPLFYFNYDDMRALKIIPHLAKSIPANSKRIMWPDHIVDAAKNGLMLRNPQGSCQPIAYFKNKHGKVVYGKAATNVENDPSIKLYMSTASGSNIFEEELIPQPDWLNSWNGIVKILRVCFGDFSALLSKELADQNILDPFMQSMLQFVIDVQNGKQNPEDVGICSAECQELLNSWKKTKATNSSPGIPSIENAPQLSALITNQQLSSLEDGPTLPPLPIINNDNSTLPNESTLPPLLPGSIPMPTISPVLAQQPSGA